MDSFFPFPESVMGGAAAVNAFAILCTLALISVALRIVWLAIRARMTGNEENPHVYMFFQTQLGNYAACLLLSMTFNTVAGILALPWLMNRGITLGAACTSQAVLTQIGTWSSGYFTVSIALHTFMSLVLKRGQSPLLSRCAMAFGWILSVIIAVLPLFVPHPNGEIYGPDTLMCGIRSAYPQMRFLLHLLPILVASTLSAILYSVIFLVLRGTIVLQGGGIRLSLDPTERWNNTDENCNRFLARVARTMIWYPVAYVALLVPYAITRLLQLSGYPVAFQALIFACVCWFMLGVVNVALLYNTFRVLGPAVDSARSQPSSKRDLESLKQPAFLDQEYSNSFAKGRMASLLPFQDRVHRFHVPMAPRPLSRVSSTGSESGLLASHGRQTSRESGYNYSVYPTYGQQDVLSSPQRSMGKIEALSNSAPSSNSEYGRHVKAPSWEVAPQSLGRVIESHRQSPSLGSIDSIDRYSPTPRLPPRQLTLLASRSNSSRATSPTSSRGESPRSSLLDTSFSNPRTPPSPPTAISRLR